MLAAMTGLQLGFTLFYIIVCVLLVGVILLQKGRGGGIGAAFGGGAGATSPFGAKTGDVFTWVTVVLGGLAILTGVIGNYVLTSTVASEAELPVSVPPDQGGGQGVAPASERVPIVPTPAPPPGESSPGESSPGPGESAAPGGERAPAGSESAAPAGATPSPPGAGAGDSAREPETDRPTR